MAEKKKASAKKKKASEEASEMKSRIMRVSMTKDEFKKFDEGETHSNNGVRTKKGSLSALPDIEEISEDDLPTREVVRTEIVYEDRYIEPAEPTWGERLAEGTANVIVDILTDPEVQESIGLLFKALWHYKVKPKISSAVQRMKEASKGETKASKLVAAQPQKQNIRYEFEMTNENAEKVVVSGETAEKLVMAMRQKAKELSAMIFLLSNIEIKDEKSESEYMLEQSYIKELVSEEAEHTMRVLVANKQILDKETVICFTDFLDGYLRNGELRIQVPALAKEE